jgi:phosphatidylinositol glycan class O
MVFKVFAPRFMYAGVGLLIVDLGSLMAVAVGMRVVNNKVLKTFGTAV